jgi:hypothetical protein
VRVDTALCVSDAADADADRVHEQLAALNLRTEKMGGDVLYVEARRRCSADAVSQAKWPIDALTVTAAHAMTV